MSKDSLVAENTTVKLLSRQPHLNLFFLDSWRYPIDTSFTSSNYLSLIISKKAYYIIKPWLIIETYIL